MKNKHLPKWNIWLAENLPLNILSISVAFIWVETFLKTYISGSSRTRVNDTHPVSGPSPRLSRFSCGFITFKFRVRVPQKLDVSHRALPIKRCFYAGIRLTLLELWCLSFECTLWLCRPTTFRDNPQAFANTQPRHNSLSLNLALSFLPSPTAHLPLTKLPYFTFNTYYLYLLNPLTPFVIKFQGNVGSCRDQRFKNVSTFVIIILHIFTSFSSPRRVYPNPNITTVHHA